jgi:ribose transport system permease protein
MDVNPWFGFVISILIGGVAGLINGLINVYLRVPAMVTTLATGYLYLTLVLVGASKMKVLPEPGFVKFVTRNVGPIPMQTVIVVIVATALALLMYKTRFGKELHALGQNRTAAYLAGVSTARVALATFFIGGLLSGLAGTMAAAVMGGAFQDMGVAYFLPSIAATFVGGTSAAGGKSSVLGVSFGALMMTLMSSFLDSAQSTFSLASGIKQLVMGAFLVSILLLSVSSAKNRNRKVNPQVQEQA